MNRIEILEVDNGYIVFVHEHIQLLGEAHHDIRSLFGEDRKTGTDKTHVYRTWPELLIGLDAIRREMGFE